MPQTQKARERADRKRKDENDVRGMIAPDSLRLVDDTATHATYRFEPVADYRPELLPSVTLRTRNGVRLQKHIRSPDRVDGVRVA